MSQHFTPSYIFTAQRDFTKLRGFYHPETGNQVRRAPISIKKNQAYRAPSKEIEEELLELVRTQHRLSLIATPIEVPVPDSETGGVPETESLEAIEGVTNRESAIAELQKRGVNVLGINTKPKAIEVAHANGYYFEGWEE